MGPQARCAIVGWIVAAGVAFPGLAHAAPPDVIRTGGPSDARDAKRAVVLSSRSLVGRSFTVTSASGRVVLRGRLRRARGSARPWRRAAVADLSAVRAPGTYRVRVAGRTASWIVVRDGEAAARPSRTS